ncbi:hypothetical protein COT99_02860 [Candidatus Falkowbacteria bacterium CG10_big_fil_rev_8_21_14_0_10_43_10]|uniref:O-antigen ligase-related domain-containing protein n=1 Tax=Candidatus Falkowbacteria bacterium CG10_big_fil_rev_8_21_14_0_10_43_10 TaxID=1974567 RepID=A0A2H0V1X1_9BACT|nr:MAG: hypothetical protein COT99_02860 [Candidatus Falkowbacteria bacterium CG10_big_fil_rev_8_21_14_0_10_43_10]
MLKQLRLYFLLIFLVEAFSFAGFYYPQLREVAFFTILAVTLLLTVHKLEYGLLILLAELFIGSKGYLFFYEYEGTQFSLRIGLFLVVMSAWLGKVLLKWASTKSGFDINEEVDKYILKSKKVFEDFGDFKNFSDNVKKKFEGIRQKNNLNIFYLVLFIFLGWGVINGYLRHNNLSDIFFDFNGWIYFGILFPVLYVFQNSENRSEQFLRDLFIVFSAAIVWLVAKTLFLVYGFSHNLLPVVYEVYRWVRVTGVGEITGTESGFTRVFFQSHIYVLIGFFIFLSLLMFYKLERKKKELLYCSIALLLCVSTILISFSRSFWVGLFIGLLFYYFILIIFFYKEWRAILWQIGTLITAGVLSVGLIYGVIKFPYPNPNANFSASLISERASTLGDAAGSSRWNLLPVLLSEIKKAPLQGEGFGATVTYVTEDPRVLEQNPSGEYTTYAFEWGWLDIWLKLGLLGLVAYLVLLGVIAVNGIKNIKYKIFNIKYLDALFSIALLSGLVMIIVTSIFSPYLNHPLGIGYVVLVSAILINKRRV